jgi:hypothetical protein
MSFNYRRKLAKYDLAPLNEITTVASVLHARVRRYHVEMIAITFYLLNLVNYDTSRLENVSGSPNIKNHKVILYVIVFKDINETKNRHQYDSQVVNFTNDLEK